MPISIDIKVNKHILHRVHIARMSGTSTKPDSINTYSAVAQLDMPTPKQWNDGLFFTHRYGDGATALTGLALQLLTEHGKLNE